MLRVKGRPYSSERPCFFFLWICDDVNEFKSTVRSLIRISSNIFAKRSILDVLQGSEYVSHYSSYINFLLLFMLIWYIEIGIRVVYLSFVFSFCYVFLKYIHACMLVLFCESCIIDTSISCKIEYWDRMWDGNVI